MTILKNILAIVSGVVLGSIVNMGIIMLSSSIIPPPEGVDPSNMESLKSSMHLFDPKHFIFPFLAHALGTLSGAFITGIIAFNNKMKLALVIGLLFLLGGISSIYMLPSPTWFAVVDLAGAYIPMAWFGGLLALRFNKK